MDPLGIHSRDNRTAPLSQRLLKEAPKADLMPRPAARTINHCRNHDGFLQCCHRQKQFNCAGEIAADSDAAYAELLHRVFNTVSATMRKYFWGGSMIAGTVRNREKLAQRNGRKTEAGNG